MPGGLLRASGTCSATTESVDKKSLSTDRRKASSGCLLCADRNGVKTRQVRLSNSQTTELKSDAYSNSATRAQCA